MIHKVAKAYGIPPHEVLRWSYGDLLMTLTVLNPQLKDRRIELNKILHRKKIDYSAALLALLVDEA